MILYSDLLSSILGYDVLLFIGLFYGFYGKLQIGLNWGYFLGILAELCGFLGELERDFLTGLRLLIGGFLLKGLLTH